MLNPSEVKTARPHFGRNISFIIFGTLLATSCVSQTTVSSQDLVYNPGQLSPTIVPSQDLSVNPVDRKQISLDCSNTTKTDEPLIENLQPGDVVLIQPRKDFLDREHGIKIIYKGSGVIEFKFIKNIIDQNNADVERISGTENSFKIKKFNALTGDTVFTATLQPGDKGVDLKVLGTCVK